MPKTVTIPLYILSIQDDGYHVFLEVKINGIKVFMLLDTGASRTVLDMATLKKIHSGIVMEENEDKATGLGSDDVENFVAALNTLEIGSLKISDYEVGVLDLTHVNASYAKINIPPVAGVFGSDILMAYNAIINYKKKTLRLDRGEK